MTSRERSGRGRGRSRGAKGLGPPALALLAALLSAGECHFQCHDRTGCRRRRASGAADSVCGFSSHTPYPPSYFLSYPSHPPSSPPLPKNTTSYLSSLPHFSPPPSLPPSPLFYPRPPPFLSLFNSPLSSSLLLLRPLLPSQPPPFLSQFPSLSISPPSPASSTQSTPILPHLISFPHLSIIHAAFFYNHRPPHLSSPSIFLSSSLHLSSFSRPLSTSASTLFLLPYFLSLLSPPPSPSLHKPPPFLPPSLPLSLCFSWHFALPFTSLLVPLFVLQIHQPHPNLFSFLLFLIILHSISPLPAIASAILYYPVSPFRSRLCSTFCYAHLCYYLRKFSCVLLHLLSLFLLLSVSPPFLLFTTHFLLFFFLAFLFLFAIPSLPPPPPFLTPKISSTTSTSSTFPFPFLPLSPQLPPITPAHPPPPLPLSHLIAQHTPSPSLPFPSSPQHTPSTPLPSLPLPLRPSTPPHPLPLPPPFPLPLVHTGEAVPGESASRRIATRGMLQALLPGILLAHLPRTINPTAADHHAPPAF
ncbi:hypothetical protein C7M84_006118 [Penaeus vannamei]|uniref:Uncharacterized protein n=1 Tax=Penaeus vannamei TaxID=6689 RepID=A0A423TFX3_PENVA|nr:hypothetical protein C7M84_006118 [Penaeus vannamei]